MEFSLIIIIIIIIMTTLSIWSCLEIRMQDEFTV